MIPTLPIRECSHGPIPKSVIDRFEAGLTKTDTCWIWIAAIDKGTGYGKFNLKRNGKWSMVCAHRTLI